MLFISSNSFLDITILVDYVRHTAFFLTIRYTRFFPDSRFPIPDSRFPIPDSRFPFSISPKTKKIAVEILSTAISIFYVTKLAN
ncbi:MAG: hypothetical protein F6K26_30770, partial [Moorea sp. SIO2I5]|nr:hypothetical protein [Moorena sp. SIO2I5]